MKNCPYCAEEIQDAAVKCRFCGEMLDSTAQTPIAEQPQPAPERREEIEDRIAQVNSLLAEGKKKDAILLAESLHAQLLSTKEVNPYIQEKKRTVEEALSALGASPVRRAMIRRLRSALLVILAVALLGAVAYKLRVNADYEAYKKLAATALTELERLEAATESGINYTKYVDKLGETKYSVKMLTQYRESYKSASLLLESQEAFETAKFHWHAKINFEAEGYSSYSFDEEDKMQAAWKSAGDSLTAAKQELASGN